MKTLLLDLDGTMYHGSKIVEGGVEFINELVKKEIPFLFLTNNSSRTKQQNLQHMLDMGYENITADQYFTSAMAAASYAKNTMNAKTAYFVGVDGLREAILDQGIEIVDEVPSDVMFVGLDKFASYETYSKALKFLQAGAKLVGTNDDRRLATNDGYAIGNGSVVKLFEYASEQESPKIGKPHAVILEEMLKAKGLKREDCIMVGDNLETDIKFGVDNGLETILVLGGVHGREDCEKLGIHPTKTVNCLSEILDEIHM